MRTCLSGHLSRYNTYAQTSNIRSETLQTRLNSHVFNKKSLRPGLGCNLTCPMRNRPDQDQVSLNIRVVPGMLLTCPTTDRSVQVRLGFCGTLSSPSEARSSSYQRLCLCMIMTSYAFSMTICIVFKLFLIGLTDMQNICFYSVISKR